MPANRRLSNKGWHGESWAVAVLGVAALFFLSSGCSSMNPCTYVVNGCSLVPTAAASGTRQECFHNSTSRPTYAVSECPGEDRDGLLCYPNCRDGYDGEGPACWENCPSGFRDDGAYCAKPAAYGRGAGYPWKVGDGLNLDGARQRCAAANPQGCEQDGYVIYPRCKPGFHAVGCCICSPDCPPGMADIGVSCQKNAYGRGAGRPMHCDPGLEMIAGLCYGECRPGWEPDGIRCYEVAETCREVPTYEACAPGEMFWFKVTAGRSECATHSVVADTEEHASQYLENCGYEVERITNLNLITNACKCTFDDELFDNGFSHCVDGRCQYCQAGDWVASNECFGC